MTNVVTMRPAVPEDEGTNPRAQYSFDISQPDPNGFVSIDACVPMSLAIEFMNLLTAYNIEKDK